MEKLNACCSALTPAILQIVKDMNGQVFVHSAQMAAIDQIRLMINQSDDTMEEKEHLRQRFLPLNITVEDEMRRDILIVKRDGQVVLTIEALAIPMLYYVEPIVG